MKKTITGLSVLLKGDQKNKAIIFLHGFPYDHSMWDNQIAALSKDFYCVAYDIRGLGNSSVGDGQFTMESFVDDLETIISELKVEKPIICAFSMGGYIALRALERMEEKFAAVILCDTVSNADSDEAKIERSDAIKRINAQGISTFSKSFINKCFSDGFKKAHKDVVEKQILKSRKFNSIGIKGGLLAMITRNDTTAYLSSIKLPVLVLCGEHDIITPPEKVQSMAEKIPGARFELIKNAGHMCVVENPDDCNALITEFLRPSL